MSIPASPGTVTVTNASATITGTGTAFTLLREGDCLVAIDGSFFVMLASDPTVDASAAITDAWGGTTASNKEYFVVARSEGAQAAATAQALLATMRSTNALATSGYWSKVASTTEQDPNAGGVGLNHATPGSATAIYVSDTDGDGNDWDGVLDALTAGARVIIQSTTRPHKRGIYSLTSQTDQGAWHKLVVTFLGGNATLDWQTDEKLIVVLASAGPTGPTGGGVETIVAGSGVAVDATDPANPIVSAGSKRPRVTKRTNVLQYGSFARGAAGWGFYSHLSEQTFFEVDVAAAGGSPSKYFNLAKAQINSTAAAKNLFIVPAKPASVDRSKGYRVGFWAAGFGPTSPLPVTMSLSCLDEGNNLLGTLTINKNLILAGDPITAQYVGIINAEGGVAPAFPAGTYSVVPRVGFVSSVANEGMHIYAMYVIAADEHPGNPATTSIANNGGGSHEAASDGTYLYVINHGFNQVAKMNANLERVGYLAIGDYPHDIVVLGSNLWVVNYDGASLQKIDAAAMTLSNTYAIPSSKGGFGLATDGASLWLSAGTTAQTPTVYSVNTSTGAMTALSTDIDGGGANIPLRHFDGSLWSIVQANSEVKRINPAGGATLATVSCGIGNIYGLGSGDGYVFANGRLGVAQIDPATNAVVATYPYRDLTSGQSNVEVSDGWAFAAASQGVMAIEIATGRCEEILLDSGSCKWVRAILDGKIAVGAYAAPWMFVLELE